MANKLLKQVMEVYDPTYDNLKWIYTGKEFVYTPYANPSPTGNRIDGKIIYFNESDGVLYYYTMEDGVMPAAPSDKIGITSPDCGEVLGYMVCHECHKSLTNVSGAKNIAIDPSDKVAIKHDAGKPEYHHFPPCLEEVAEVFTFGAKKYAAYNYRKGMSHSRYFNAAMRHMWAYWRGEDIDPESGKSHLAHAICCLLMLLQNKNDKVGQDGRFRF